MKKLFLFLFLCSGIFRFVVAQDTIEKPWYYIVDGYAEKLQERKQLTQKLVRGVPVEDLFDEEKLLILQQNKPLIKKQLVKELTRRQDAITIYNRKGGSWDWDISYDFYIENLIDSFLNTMLPRDAEGRIKSTKPQVTFTNSTSVNLSQCPSYVVPNTNSFIFELKKTPPKKIHQKPKEVPVKQRRISGFDFNQKITLNLASGFHVRLKTGSEEKPEIKKIPDFPFSCSVGKNKILKKKLARSWCSTFYKDEKGKELLNLFACAGLMSGCTGIEFFENDSCKEYSSAMLSCFGTFPKRKTGFSVKDSILIFTIKTSEGKTEFERYRIIKAEETEILLEKINDGITTAVPFLLIEPSCGFGFGAMGDCGVKK